MCGLFQINTTFLAVNGDDNDFLPCAKIDLLIKGYYLYKNFPLVKLRCLDTEKAFLLVEQNKLDFVVLQAQRTEQIAMPNGLVDEDKYNICTAIDEVFFTS